MIGFHAAILANNAKLIAPKRVAEVVDYVDIAPLFAEAMCCKLASSNRPMLPRLAQEQDLDSALAALDSSLQECL